MKKSYRKSRKSYRRKRSYRKRRGFKLKSDGAIALKVYSDTPVYHRSAVNHADVSINWCGSASAGGLGSSISFPGTNEY